jgi:hypothetical protein
VAVRVLVRVAVGTTQFGAAACTTARGGLKQRTGARTIIAAAGL